MSTLNYDNLVDLSYKPQTFNLTLLSGENVVRGEVLAYNTSTNKIESYDSGGSNGVNEFYGIAVEDTDATSGDTAIAVYVAGTFNINQLTFSASGDSATQAVINAARAKGVVLKDFRTGENT